MKTTSILIVIAATLAIGAASLNADEPMARLSDKDVKNLVNTIEKQNKSFKRALDSKFKRSILRGPGGEVQISHPPNLKLVSLRPKLLYRLVKQAASTPPP